MDTLSLPTSHTATPPEPFLQVETDLDLNGNVGTETLRLKTGELTVDRGPGIASLRLSLEEITKVKVEELVDAVALVAYQGESKTELIRTTSGRHLLLSDAARKLQALIDKEPFPEGEATLHVCPKCQRPLIEGSEFCVGCVNRGKTLLRLFQYTSGQKPRLIWGTFLTLGGTLIELLPPIVTLVFVDNVLIGKELGLFWPLLFALLASRVVLMGVQMARGRNVAFLGMQITSAIRDSLFSKIQSLSMSFYDKRNVGSIMSRVSNDTGALYDVLIDGIPVVLNQLALVIGIPIALFLINPSMAIWAIAPLPIVALAVNFFHKTMRRVWSRFYHQWSRMSGSLNGVLQGTKVVKAFHGESRETARFARRISDVARTGYQAENSWATFFPVVLFTMALSTIVVWGVGGNQVLGNRMTLGELTAFIAYVAMLQQPLMMLQRIIDWSSRALTAAERVFDYMDTPIDIEDAPDAVAMPDVKGSVTFKDVRFGYDKTHEVLHGINLEVKAGEMIGIVGHSGAGKSTLINLLMRFYDPTQGSIKIDDVDLRKVKIDDLRRQIGVVLQDSYLFPGSVRDNIAYGRPEATLNEVIEAARAANAHKFIINFTDGYDSFVGERGQRLSGGERQRIAIARAILHNPKVLILDEATASVDTETERMIQEALERLIKNRTTFAIAHRLSTLRQADRIVVIDKGKVAEIGTHDELLKIEDGIFAKLVNMQTEINTVRDNFIAEG